MDSSAVLLPKTIAMRKMKTEIGHRYTLKLRNSGYIYGIKLYDRGMPSTVNYENYASQAGLLIKNDDELCGTFTASADTTLFTIKDLSGNDERTLLLKSFSLTDLDVTYCYDTTIGQGGYAYRYNGQKTSPEIGSGHQTALYWEYDARTGRRWNLDPVREHFISQYATFGGNPVNSVDENRKYL